MDIIRVFHLVTVGTWLSRPATQAVGNDAGHTDCPQALAGRRRRELPIGTLAAGGVAAELERDGHYGSVCICVPTYNEAENVEPFVNALLAVFDRDGIDGTVLVIDDGSPDGTGELADRLNERDQRVRVLHRNLKSGIGRAYQAGFAWALERGFDLIAQMDCDFSHDPASLCALLAATRRADLAIGSRYVEGGGVRGWPLRRRLISRGGCWYARTLLRLPVLDLTGGFKCFRRQVLEQLPYLRAEAHGYGFQIETTYRSVQAGLRVVEVPIVFRDRFAGDSKMSLAITCEAALLVLKLRLSPNLKPREPEPEARPRDAASTVSPRENIHPDRQDRRAKRSFAMSAENAQRGRAADHGCLERS
jgi:dolichol-phosphate mannosyltransferase